MAVVCIVCLDGRHLKEDYKMADNEVQGNGQEGKRKTSIQGELFWLTTPYKEGHVCNEREAGVLNQVRLENIGNNWRRSVTEAIKLRDEQGDGGAKLNEVAQLIAQADVEYEFGKVTARSTSDPYEREARAIARDAIKAQLAEDGRKIEDVDEDKLEEVIANTAMQEDVMDLAKVRVDSRRKSKGINIVGNLGVKEEPAQEQAS